jgi:hypothetical protein
LSDLRHHSEFLSAAGQHERANDIARRAACHANAIRL